MRLVHNTTSRPETLTVIGGKALRFPPGRTEISEEDYAALVAPEGGKQSMFSWFVDQGMFAVNVPITEAPPETPKPKAVVKAEEKVGEAERNLLREEINAVMKSKKRSMKYDDLAADFCITRDELKELIKVKAGKEDDSRLFLEWLQSETK